jgi:hypothetical protein
MKVEDLMSLNIGDEVAVLRLVCHVDDIFSLERNLITVRIKHLLNVFTSRRMKRKKKK